MFSIYKIVRSKLQIWIFVVKSQIFLFCQPVLFTGEGGGRGPDTNHQTSLASLPQAFGSSTKHPDLLLVLSGSINPNTDLHCQASPKCRGWGSCLKILNSCPCHVLDSVLHSTAGSCGFVHVHAPKSSEFHSNESTFHDFHPFHPLPSLALNDAKASRRVPAIRWPRQSESHTSQLRYHDGELVHGRSTLP
jgi:hypothetical protein